MIANSFLQEYDDILLPEDIQKILHIGRNAVYTSLANGTIRSIRIGKKYRIPKLYLQEFIYSNKSEKDDDQKKEG